MLIPSAFFPVYIQSGVTSMALSLFCRNMMSLVTCVPVPVKAITGSLTAPTSSALCAMYFLTFSFALSRVPLLVMNAIIPPGLTLSMVLAKK